MKEEIVKFAKKQTKITDRRDFDTMLYRKINCIEYDSIIVGAEWMLEQYNGITPETVKEMLEALRKVNDEAQHVERFRGGRISPSFVLATISSAILKAEAEQELNQG